MQTELGDECVSARRLDIAVLAARTADDQQLSVGSIELGECSNRDVGPLERLDAPNEQQHQAIGFDVDRAEIGRAHV